MKESSSDFSIVKNYIELKGKYDQEIKGYSEKIKALEEKYKKHIADLEQEIRKRNDHIKARDQKIQELSQGIAERDEKLKTLGLQLHKLKMESTEKEAVPSESGDSSKKGKFGLFK